MPSHRPGNIDYALDIGASMADSESDLETDGLELALDTLCSRHCRDQSSLQSKEYCSGFCQLVEEYTGQWQVPLPQLKVLRTALSGFTKATAPFPDDCQHIHYVLSSLALSFFELLLFFGQEEFVEDPLKDIIDCFKRCHSQLLRHRNSYLHQVKHIIKSGGPWENPVLQKILKGADLQPNEVEEYLSSELPVFLELRVRYLQACERLKEAMALSKSCLENHEAGKHLFFHQAYLTCLYKASLHEHLHKEMAEIDGRDAVEIICNTERVEKDEVLLSLCKAFLTQYLHNGDMYYIWDLLFIWSRLHLRAHPSREGFLAECLSLASSATNVRAIFPFIKLVTTEVGGEGVEVCLELCASALQLCDVQDDSETRSLVCKTIAFLLPHDLEICRASALLVFCQERSLEAYRTVCLLYMHPDQEPHPHNSPVRTNVRFQILQLLKERLCFDPEFWNLLTLRTYCLELLSDNVIKAAVLSEMKEEEEKQLNEEVSKSILNESCLKDQNIPQCTEAELVSRDLVNQQGDTSTENHVSPPNQTLWPVKKLRKRGRPRKHVPLSDNEAEPVDDPEFKYPMKSPSLSNKPIYSLRRSHINVEISGSGRSTLNHNREYLSRCVKSQILSRRGRRRLWMPVLPKESILKIIGKKRGRKPLVRLEYFYPDNEILLTDGGLGTEEVPERTVQEVDFSEEKENNFLQTTDHENQSDIRKSTDLVSVESNEHITDEPLVGEGPPSDLQPPAPAVEGDPELDGPPLEFLGCPVEILHCYCLINGNLNSDHQGPEESSVPEELNGDIEPEPYSLEETGASKTEGKTKRTWKEKLLRTQQFSHMKHHCSICGKDYKGLNIMRHAISHLKRRRLKCILCGKRFKHFSFAKEHIVDHFEEMCKEKEPCKDKEPCKEKEPCIETIAPADNGLVENQEKETQNPQEEVQRKTATKFRVSDLSREQRIIRNIRTLIKKTTLQHKKGKHPESVLFKHAEFRDEQVVIADCQAFIRDPCVTEDTEGGEQGDNDGQGENDIDLAQDTYYLCPSESCDRVFIRSNNALIRHAIKSHIDEEGVLEKTFVWANKKCKLCFRQLQFFQHYKEHMKLHDDPLQHFCYHLDCNQRFATQQELKDHVVAHKPFNPQCPFPGCEKLFSSLQSLCDHEWRHYNPAPQRDELEHGGRREVQNPEAPWKQRLKVEELWLQVKRDRKDSPTPEHTVALPVLKPEESCEENVENSSEGIVESGSISGTPENCKPQINGHENTSETSVDNVSETETSPTGKGQKRQPYQPDPLNVKEAHNVATMVEGVQQGLGNPHITEHKTFKPEDPAYATFVKAPFVRPPPSTYLTESVLSMRKRRLADDQEVTPKKTFSWNSRKKKDPEKKDEPQETPPEAKTRHRCSKCLSSYSSLEELQQHEALNTCSALFGFDSDDES